MESDRFALILKQMDWQEAKSYCENVFNSSLATIIDGDALFQAVALRESLHELHDLWIGLNDFSENGEWTWVDGTSWYFTISL